MFIRNPEPQSRHHWRCPSRVLAGVISCVAGMPLNALAAGASGALDVRLRLEPGCELISDRTESALLDFGRTAASGDAPTRESDAIRSLATIRLACTSSYVGVNAPVLTVGHGLHARDSQRHLLGPAGERIAYDLYADPAHRIPLDPGAPMQLSLLAAGVVTPVPIYGEVPHVGDPTAGLYTDVVSLTFSY
jgi:spore coat protein U-like protein